MNKKPNPFMAGFLCLISPMLGPLYAARGGWAAFYFVATSAAIVTAMIYLHHMPLVILLVPVVYIASIVHAYLLASAYPAERQRPHYSRWYGLLGIHLGMSVVVIGIRAFLFEPFQQPSGSMLPTIEVGSYLVAQKWGFGHYSTFSVTIAQEPITAELRQGDVVVFDHSTENGRTVQFVKRLIGLPGDTVAYRDKKLSINGKEVPQVREGDYMDVRTGKGKLRLARYGESLGGTKYSVAINEDAHWNIADAPMFVHQDACEYDEHGETCKIPAGHYFVMGDNRDNSNDSRYWGFVPADHIVGRVAYVF